MKAILANPIAKLHDPGPGHPEQPARFDAVLRGLSAWPLTAYQPRDAALDELALAHDREYIRTAMRDVAAGLSELSTGDTQICERSYDVALRSVGTVLTAVDLVMSGAMSGDAASAFAQYGRPVITQPTTAAWAFACSTTSRSPRATHRSSMESDAS